MWKPRLPVCQIFMKFGIAVLRKKASSDCEFCKYRLGDSHASFIVLPRTGHEGPEGSRGIALLFL